MRLAAIDIGTNTASLLIADVDNEGRLQPQHSDKRFIRLGEGVDASGIINEAAVQRLLTALQTYQAVAKSHGAKEIVIGGTSASRDAANHEEIVARVYKNTGLTYTIISGEEEARWTFAGATSVFTDLTAPCVVLDIGGGSTEVVLGDPTTHHLTYRRSFNVGTVRLSERLFPNYPPPPDAIRKTEALLYDTWASIDAPITSTTPFIGAAGTAVVLALLDRPHIPNLNAFTATDVELTKADVDRWQKRILNLDLPSIYALHPTVMHGRADLIGMGTMILLTFMEHFNLETCHVSPGELRHGLALRLAQSLSKS